MHNNEEISARIAQIEQHITSQDLEVYRQQRLIDALQKQLIKLHERIESLQQGGGAHDMPADEKPPHY